MTPKVSIVVLNYNQLKVTCEFLDSTEKLSYPDYEIILVDNCSPEDPTEVITSRYPEVKLIVNKENLGFAGGNNEGLKVAQGDYYFIVNNDTEVTPDLLEKLIAPFLQHPEIGIVCPKIRYFTKPNMIQYAGFREINPFTGRNSTVGQHEIDVGQHDTPAFTCYAHGAAMMVKKEVVQQVGLMPDIFFLYYEELDWSARIRQAGYKIYYQPQALIYHKESISVGKDSPLKAYYMNRNRILFMRRNTSKKQFMYFLFFLTVVAIPKNTLKYLLRGQFTHLRNFGKAIAWNLNHPKYI